MSPPPGGGLNRLKSVSNQPVPDGTPKLPSSNKHTYNRSN